MKKRRGNTATSAAAAAAALIIGGGAAVGSINAIVPTTIMAAASSPSAGIRGGSNNIASNNKRIENQRRPAILDSHQADKIQQWKEDRNSRSNRLLSSSSNSNNDDEQINQNKKALGSVLPHVTSSGKRRLYEYMTINHKKESSGSVSHVSKLDDDKFHFQTQPTTTTTTTATTTSTSTAAAANIVANNSGGGTYYYPISTPDHSVGTCTNNGNEPDHYTLSNGFLYMTLEECCEEWFVSAEECMVGFATVTSGEGELLLRDPYTGVLLSELPPPVISESSSSSSGGGTTSTSNVFYPSFDMATYPDGACLNDGNQPDIYNTQVGYIFDSIDVCCRDWFIDELGCELTSLQALDGGDEPVPSPAVEETDYPTWSAEFDYDDDDDDDDDTTVPQEESSSMMTSQEEESLSFYDSFESGDFSHYWRLTSSSPSADLWEADQSAWAYDGTYAARAGVLSEPNSQTNLTISLGDIHSLRHGGYLTFAIHASVSKPVDVLSFAINDNVIRTFEEVTGDEGDWEEVSVLLHAGEHRLTWSYQYFGGMTSSVDPRRVGNSWVDAIKLRPFTGDVTIGDDDDTTLTLTNGMAPFELLPVAGAFIGSKSFVAHTGAIDASQGTAEMSWEVYIGPSGGVISFAAYASLYAPRDVCEFSIDGVPQVIIATFSDDWETHQVAVGAGKHELKWKLIKNFAGLNTAIIDDVDVPSGYQGYVKIDGINLEDNSVTHFVDEEVMIAAVGEVANTMPTTTVATTTTTSKPITTTTTKATTTSTTTTTEEPTTTVAPTIAFVECPSDLFSVEGLPGCCVEDPSYLGDGACDPRAPYNTEECAFDLGDCCHETCNSDSAYGCKTKEGGEYGPFGFFCLDPRFGNMDEKKCQVENLEWIGDGGCDTAGGYNTPECGWDGGDCCEDTCDSEYAFYPCGANQAYVCMDPSVVNKETKSDSPFSFQDGFESGVFDPLHWDVDDGDAEWKIDDSKPAAEGNYYISARTGDISLDFGTAKLKHGIQSFGGGVLSFDIQALVQIPFDDLIIMIDDDVVAEFSSATTGWERQELDIPTGPHLVQWIHRKNPSNMLEADLKLFGYPDEGVTMIDNIAFQPS